MFATEWNRSLHNTIRPRFCKRELGAFITAFCAFVWLHRRPKMRAFCSSDLIRAWSAENEWPFLEICEMVGPNFIYEFFTQYVIHFLFFYIEKCNFWNKNRIEFFAESVQNFSSLQFRDSFILLPWWMKQIFVYQIAKKMIFMRY